MQLQIANSIGVSVGFWIPKICVIDLHVIASRPIWRPHASFHSLLGRLCLDFLLDMSPAARPFPSHQDLPNLDSSAASPQA